MRRVVLLAVIAAVLPVAACSASSTPTQSTTPTSLGESGLLVADDLDGLAGLPGLDPLTEMAGAIYLSLDEAPGDNDRQRLEAVAADAELQQRAAEAGITITFVPGAEESTVVVEKRGDGECRVVAQDDGRAMTCNAP